MKYTKQDLIQINPLCQDSTIISYWLSFMWVKTVSYLLTQLLSYDWGTLASSSHCTLIAAAHRTTEQCDTRWPDQRKHTHM